MRKNLTALLLVLLLALPMGGCGSYQKYQRDFYDVFDTYTMVVGYAKSQQEFDQYGDIIYGEMLRLHQLFDIYNDYAGVNNLKTVNDYAGVAPVSVDPAVIKLLLEARLAYSESGGAVNAAMGSVLKLWHNYRELGIADPAHASIPTEAELRVANAHVNIDNMIIDETNSTVYLRDPAMALDVGALAKGFAVQLAMDKAKAAGFTSGLISAGGNVSAVGKPMDDRANWSIGIQSPVFMPDGSQPLFDTITTRDNAIVSSGDYQRFYVVDGKIYHHIIDPETCMPANRYAAVTVIHPDSGIADMLSTAVFILPYEEGLALVQKYSAEAIWIDLENNFLATEGYKAMSQL